MRPSGLQPASLACSWPRPYLPATSARQIRTLAGDLLVARQDRRQRMDGPARLGRLIRLRQCLRSTANRSQISEARNMGRALHPAARLAAAASAHIRKRSQGLTDVCRVNLLWQYTAVRANAVRSTPGISEAWQRAELDAARNCPDSSGKHLKRHSRRSPHRRCIQMCILRRAGSQAEDRDRNIRNSVSVSSWPRPHLIKSISVEIESWSRR